MYSDTDEPELVQHDVGSSESLTSNLPPSPIIQGIDQEIAHYAQIIIGLKVRRNSHQPISRLPVEVLCKIFALAQQCWPVAARRTIGSLPQELSWTVVTRVCHFWRNASLGEPSLWTRPPLQYKKWTAVFLERSRKAGLALSFCDKRSIEDSEYTAAVVSHMPRTTSLTVRIERATMRKLFGHISTTIAPKLETVTIAIVPPGGSFSLPVTAISGAKLRQLSLNFVKIAWNSHLLFGLTDLNLSQIPTSARPTPTELLLVLEQNPALRNLTLNNALPRMARVLEASTYANHRIFLQSLETLRIGSKAPVCEFFYNHIQLSDKIKSIDTSIPYNNDSNSSRHVHQILSALQKAYIGPRLGSLSCSAQIKTCTAYHDGSTSNVTVLSTAVNATPIDFDNCLSESFQSLSNAPDIQLFVYAKSAADISMTDEVSDFFQGLYWDNLSQLDLSLLRGNRYFAGLDAILAATFGTLPGLRVVAVGPSSASHLINALVINSDKDPALFPNSITFPALQYINLSQVTFTNTQNSSSNLLHMGSLLDCLMDRYERGAEIHSIAINKCRLFRKHDYELLKEVVLGVKWDSCSDH